MWIDPLPTASVVDFPDPVGPVTSTMPRNLGNFFKNLGAIQLPQASPLEELSVQNRTGTSVPG